MSLCLHNICLCAVYNHFVYINTYACMYIFKNYLQCVYLYLQNNYTAHKKKQTLDSLNGHNAADSTGILC